MNREAMARYKKIILYFIKHFDFAPSNRDITDFLLAENYVPYFHAQQALSELEQDGYIVKKTGNAKTCYEITSEGSSILDYTPLEPPKAIRDETLSYIKKQYGKLRIEKSTPSDYIKTENGSYLATLSLIQEKNTVFSVSISCPDEALAQKMCLNWQKNCPDIYALLLENLM